MSKQYKYSDLPEAQQDVLKALRSNLGVFPGSTQQELNNVLTDTQVSVTALRKTIVRLKKDPVPEACTPLLKQVTDSQILSLKGTIVFRQPDPEPVPEAPASKRRSVSHEYPASVKLRSVLDKLAAMGQTATV